MSPSEWLNIVFLESNLQGKKSNLSLLHPSYKFSFYFVGIRPVVLCQITLTF